MPSKAKPAPQAAPRLIKRADGLMDRLTVCPPKAAKSAKSYTGQRANTWQGSLYHTLRTTKRVETVRGRDEAGAWSDTRRTFCVEPDTPYVSPREMSTWAVLKAGEEAQLRAWKRVTAGAGKVSYKTGAVCAWPR